MKQLSLKNLPEEELATFQSKQKGNDCALHAITAALLLLNGVTLPAQDLSNEVNRLWWRGRFYRVFPGWGVTPGMQTRLVNYLARTHHVPIHAKMINLSIEKLLTLMNNDNLAVLVTIYWLPRKAPAIYKGASALNYNNTRKPSGHTMLLAAYDPEHKSGEHLTPWGFINSWVDAGSEIFWMEDLAFKKAWNVAFLPPTFHPGVIIERTS